MRSVVLSCLLVSMLALSYSCADKQDSEADQEIPLSSDSSKVTRPDNVNPYVTVDVSPMDMSYFPPDYPKLRMEKKITFPPLAKIIYSRPHLGGRRLFPDIQKYGEPWRLGANESTELELYKAAAILHKKIPAGRYVLYCLPQQDKWTIILNSNIDSWGLRPDPTMDLFRFEVPVKKMDRRIEFFTMVFEKTTTGADLVMAWDDLEARLPIIFE